MTNVLILGANGSLARVAIDMFLKETDAQVDALFAYSTKTQKN